MFVFCNKISRYSCGLKAFINRQRWFYEISKYLTYMDFLSIVINFSFSTVLWNPVEMGIMKYDKIN